MFNAGNKIVAYGKNSNPTTKKVVRTTMVKIGFLFSEDDSCTTDSEGAYICDCRCTKRVSEADINHSTPSVTQEVGDLFDMQFVEATGDVTTEHDAIPATNDDMAEVDNNEYSLETLDTGNLDFSVDSEFDFDKYLEGF